MLKVGLILILSMGLAFGQAHAQRPDPFAPSPPAQAKPSYSASAKGPYLFDIPKLFPAAFNLWTQSLPRSVEWPNWISKLDGVSSPLRDVAVGGKSMKFGTVCMPHDCGDNVGGILFNPQQTRIIAIVRMRGQNQTPTLMVIGQMSGPEYACMQSLLDDHTDTVAICP